MVRFVLDPRAQVEINKIADRLASRTAHAIAADARRYSPVDTGALRSGIHVEDAGTGQANIVAERNVAGEDPKVPIYVEMGTQHAAAQPYLRPAAFQTRALSA